jgi:hypothetical protein
MSVYLCFHPLINLFQSSTKPHSRMIEVNNILTYIYRLVRTFMNDMIYVFEVPGIKDNFLLEEYEWIDPD